MTERKQSFKLHTLIIIGMILLASVGLAVSQTQIYDTWIKAEQINGTTIYQSGNQVLDSSSSIAASKITAGTLSGDFSFNGIINGAQDKGIQFYPDMYHRLYYNSSTTTSNLESAQPIKILAGYGTVTQYNYGSGIDTAFGITPQNDNAGTHAFYVTNAANNAYKFSVDNTGTIIDGSVPAARVTAGSLGAGDYSFPSASRVLINGDGGTPDSQLQVLGTILASTATGASRKQVYIGYDAGNDYGQIDVYAIGVGSKPLMLQPNNGQIQTGIGNFNFGGNAYFNPGNTISLDTDGAPRIQRGGNSDTNFYIVADGGSIAQAIDQNGHTTFYGNVNIIKNSNQILTLNSTIGDGGYIEQDFIVGNRSARIVLTGQSFGDANYGQGDLTLQTLNSGTGFRFSTSDYTNALTISPAGIVSTANLNVSSTSYGACSTANQGFIVFDATSKKFYGCNSTAWSALN